MVDVRKQKEHIFVSTIARVWWAIQLSYVCLCACFCVFYLLYDLNESQSKLSTINIFMIPNGQFPDSMSNFIVSRGRTQNGCAFALLHQFVNYLTDMVIEFLITNCEKFFVMHRSR